MAMNVPKFDLDMTKLMADFKIPGVDLEVVMATQRRNIEALTRANQLAVEGFQAVARRQAEIIRHGFEQATSVVQDMMQVTSPEDRVSKHTDVAKKSIETAITNARELAEIFSKAQTEAFEVLNKRMTEGLDEVRHFVKK